MDVEVQSNAYEYLYATIKTADWIDDDYKKLAEQYKAHKALNELYLCICDRVNIDMLELIEINDDVESVLRKCRKKHLESDFIRRYSDVVERISVITATTEHEVKNMSHTVKYIADVLPSKTGIEMLPEPIEIYEEEMESEELSQKKVTSQKIDEKVESVMEAKPVDVTDNEKNEWIDVLMAPIEKFMNRYRRNPKRTVVDMLSQGYSDEQINFIYSCIDEGMTNKEIDKLADPKINVETMKKLKKVVLKEREKNGYR